MNETDSCERSFCSDGSVKHQEEGTPQRRVSCAPKSMDGEMGVLSCEQENCKSRKPNMNRVTTIAGLLQSHGVTMETNSSNQQQRGSVEIYDEGDSFFISQPVKRTSSEDVNSTLASTLDEVSNRPFKRRRKLIVTNIPEGDEETSVTEEYNGNKETLEQIATPVNNLKPQTNEDAGIIGSVKTKSFFTSTPNDITYNNDIASADEDTVVPSTAYHYKRRRVLRRAPAGAHMTVTGTDGTRVYLRLSNEPKNQDKQERPKRYQLLSIPFYQLKHEVESRVCVVVYL